MFGVAGQANPAPQVAPEIAPVWVMQNDRPEDRFLLSDRLWGVGGDVAAVAAQNTFLNVGNPAASGNNPGLLVLIEAVECWNPSGAVQEFSEYIGALGIGGPALGVMQNDDQRWTGIAQVSVTGGTNAVVPPAGLKRSNIVVPSALPYYPLQRPIVLAPGTAWAMVSQGVNFSMTFRVWGRQRALGQLETGLG